MAIRAMTIAILSDIHGNIAALDAVLADIAARGVTRIVNLGDILSGPDLGEGAVHPFVEIQRQRLAVGRQ